MLDPIIYMLAVLGAYRVGRRSAIIVYAIWKYWGEETGPWLGMRPWSY